MTHTLMTVDHRLLAEILGNTFDARVWSRLPFHFWSIVFFVFGCNIGSFLNVCIHRLPLGQSIVSPPSHCPHCKYSIPWYLNIPLLTWVWLRGKCRNCGAPISPRYFLVELLTGLTFLACWNAFGHQSAFLALVYCLFLSGLIVGTFVDIEHLIVPDEITIGGMVVGVICSAAVPVMQGEDHWYGGLWKWALGAGVGAGVIYAVVRGGKLVFGRQHVSLPAQAKIIFSETAVHLPDGDVPYDDLFYRKSDVIAVHAKTVELADRCYRDIKVRLSPEKLIIGEDEFNPEEIPHMEVVSEEIVLPREAMGFGDVKFMGAIGAFLGWKAVFFTLTVSAMIGSAYGITMIATRRQTWSGRLWFCPFMALAATLWIFDGRALVNWYEGLIQHMLGGQ